MEWILTLGSLSSVVLRYLPQVIKIAPDVMELMAKGKPILDAILALSPELLPIIERISHKMFPADAAHPVKSEKTKALVAKALIAPHTMTKEEENLFKRAEGGQG